MTVPDVGSEREAIFVMPVERYEARCSCGWSQLHSTSQNAIRDAREHSTEWHDGQPEVRYQGRGYMAEHRAATP